MYKNIKENSQNQKSLVSHERNYIVFGHPKTKFQLSFKWKLFESNHFYFAYTQMAFWEIFKESSPFKEIHFSPEIFYRFQSKTYNNFTLDLGLFQHTSNGKDKNNSRSYDQSYIRFKTQRSFSSNLNFELINKFTYQYNISPNNYDIHKYLGFYEIILKLKNFTNILFNEEEVYLKYVPGKNIFILNDQQYGFLNVGFNFRFQKSQILPTFLFDYYSGTSETLIDYQKKVRSLRFGIIKTFN